MRSRIFRENIGTNLHLGVRGECDIPTNLDVRCGCEPRGGIRELNNIRRDVTDIRYRGKIEGWTDSEIGYFDS